MKSSLPFRLLLTSIVFLSFFTLQAQVKFSYLGQYNTLGVPDNLEDTSDIVGQDFLNDINTALPETKAVPDFHPEYISKKNETDVVLTAQTDLWITFVHEGAGYTNALGYYTYPASNPPKTTADIQTRWIIFPNVSYENSGGGLKSGNKVYLGKFDANTAVGWFVVADAFKSGKLTQGKYIVYSEPSLNSEKDTALKAHTVLLKDSKRNKLVLGFEDMLRDQGSDQDFNDLIFYITASKYTAINTTNVVAIDGSGTYNNTTGTTTTTTTTTPTPTTPTVPATTPTTTNNNTTNNNTTNNNPNININNNVNNNGQNGTGGSSTNTTNTTNNVNTGTNTTTSNNSNNTTTNNNTNTNSNNTTTVINNTTVINKTGGGGHGGGKNNNGTNNNNNNTNTNVNNNTNNNGGGNNGGNGNGNNNNNNNNNGNGNNSNNTIVSNVTVCNRDGFALSNFTTLKTTIKAQTVESNKPMVIKQAVKNKRVTVSQVKEIIKLIVVEQYKLDMAKYLFDFTCDKSNYYELNALLMPSRARELDAYLKNKDMSDDNVTNVNTTVTNGSTTQNNSTNTYVENNTNYSSSSNTILCDNGRMPYEEFDDIKQSISSKPFSDSKISILKEAMPTRCINSLQVKEIMGLFSFEADKLTVSKYLYRFTSDKQNYYKVNDAFTFSSSIDELKGYIKSAK